MVVTDFKTLWVWEWVRSLRRNSKLLLLRGNGLAHVCTLATTWHTWKPWRGWEMAKQLISSGTFWGWGRFCFHLLFLPPSPLSFVKITHLEVARRFLCLLHIFLTQCQKHGRVFFCCSLFVYINSLLELQPSPSLPAEVMAWVGSLSQEKGVSDTAGFISCLSNKIFSELNQKTCTIELRVKLFL